MKNKTEKKEYMRNYMRNYRASEGEKYKKYKKEYHKIYYQKNKLKLLNHNKLRSKNLTIAAKLLKKIVEEYDWSVEFDQSPHFFPIVEEIRECLNKLGKKT